MKSAYSEIKLYERSYQMIQTIFWKAAQTQHLALENFESNPADPCHAIFCVVLVPE